MINNILQQQEKMLQQQTQLLIQNLHSNTLEPQATNYSFNPEQFRSPLQSFNNPRLVKVPLNVVKSSEKCLPVIVTPSSTSTLPSAIVPFSVPSYTSTISPITFSASDFNSSSTSSQATK